MFASLQATGSNVVEDECQEQAYRNGQQKMLDGTFSYSLNFHPDEEAEYTRKKDFVCNICGAGFYSRDSMMEHKKGMHQNRTYTCPCGLVFKWRQSLRNHKDRCKVAASLVE